MKRQDNLMKDYSRFVCCAKEQGETTIEPICERLSNMYENEDAPRKIGFKIVGVGEFSVDCEFAVAPFDEKELILQTKAAGGEEVYVDLPDLTDSFGAFMLFITLKKNGKKVICQPLPFSHLRTAKSHFKKSGTCIHLFYHDIPDTYECFELVKKCGIYKVRDDILWQHNESEKGKPEVKPNYMHTIDGFYEEDTEINFILDYGNNFYDNGRAPYTEEGLEAYCNYCRAVAETLKGRITRYEIWNEYNLGFGRSNCSPEEYTWMLKSAYKTLKEVDPNIIVSAGVTCGTAPEWLRRMLEAGAYDYFDKFSIHPYCGVTDTTYADERQGQAEANVQSCIDVIKEYGPEKPVWISEMGWTSTGYNCATREEQAAAITRLFATSETSDIIDGLIFYDFRNDGINNFDMECNWGLIEAQGSIVPNAAKEAYAAVSCLNFMIAGLDYTDKTVTDYIKHIEYAGGKTNIIWSLDGDKKVTFKVDGDVEVYDMYGNKKKVCVKDGVLVLDIEANVTYINGAKMSVVKVDKPDVIIYDYPYTLSAVPVKKQDGWYLKGIVKCHTDSLKGRLRIELPELELGGNYERFTIADGEKFEVEIKVGEELDLKKRYRALIDLNLEDGLRDVKQELVSFLQVPYGKTDKALFKLDSNEYYVRIGGVERPELKADISLSYDEEKFYIYAEVFDKCHLQEGLTSEHWMDIWDGSCLEFILQPLYDGNSDKTRYSHIGMALTSNTKTEVVWRWRTVSNRSMTVMREAEYEFKREGDITTYRAAFEWRDLLPPNVELSDCDSFGFCMRVDFAESDKHSIDGYTQIYGGMGNWRAPFTFQPTEFGRIVLEKK